MLVTYNEHILTYGYSKNTRPTREACEASTNSVLLLLIGPIRSRVAMHVQLCIRKIFFCLVAPLTQRSDSKAIHKFSKFITGISFYYIQQVINPHRQRGYIINTKVFTTQQITIHEMNFNSTNPRRWKCLL